MRTFTITTAQVAACPLGSLDPNHYHDDGTCRCMPPMPPTVRKRVERRLDRVARELLDQEEEE